MPRLFGLIKTAFGVDHIAPTVQSNRLYGDGVRVVITLIRPLFLLRQTKTLAAFAGHSNYVRRNKSGNLLWQNTHECLFRQNTAGVVNVKWGEYSGFSAAAQNGGDQFLLSSIFMAFHRAADIFI